MLPARDEDDDDDDDDGINTNFIIRNVLSVLSGPGNEDNSCFKNAKL